MVPDAGCLQILPPARLRLLDEVAKGLGGLALRGSPLSTGSLKLFVLRAHIVGIALAAAALMC